MVTKVPRLCFSDLSGHMCFSDLSGHIFPKAQVASNKNANKLKQDTFSEMFNRNIYLNAGLQIRSGQICKLVLMIHYLTSYTAVELVMPIFNQQQYYILSRSEEVFVQQCNSLAFEQIQIFAQQRTPFDELIFGAGVLMLLCAQASVYKKSSLIFITHQFVILTP